jgi:hypothetical protein
LESIFSQAKPTRAITTTEHPSGGKAKLAPKKDFSLGLSLSIEKNSFRKPLVASLNPG